MTFSIKDIIRADKTNVQISRDWKSGHIPRARFSLSRAKNKAYKFGSAYKWRTISFDALGHKCTVLVLLNTGKQICRMTLGVEEAGDMKVLGHHEYHSSEPGWHCHVHRKPINKIEGGIFRKGQERWPKNEELTNNKEFNANTDNAIGLAADFFNIQNTGTLL